MVRSPRSVTRSDALTRRIVATGALVAATAWIAAPAEAYDAGGQWYIDVFHIKDFHAQGIDGTGVTVAVVDTAINLDVPELKGADIRVKEPSQCYGPGGAGQSSVSDDPALAFHGTNMVIDIVGNGAGYDGQTGITGIAPKATVLFYSMGAANGVCESPGALTSAEGLVWSNMVSTAIIDATDQGAAIISLSISSTGGLLDDALAYAMHRGVIVVASLTNQTSSDDLLANADGWPAVNNGVVSVGALDAEGKVLINGMGEPSTSDYVDVVAPGADILTRGDGVTSWQTQGIDKGNSFATAITAGNVALAIQKYPTATHNQIIQSLIHNTDAQPHKFRYDSKHQYGYGVADTISLLAADPTHYEDVNPLLVEGALIGPTPQQVLDGLGASPSPSASSDPTAQPTANATPAPHPGDGSSSPMMWLLIGGGVLLLILIGVGITIAVASSKPKNTES